MRGFGLRGVGAAALAGAVMLLSPAPAAAQAGWPPSNIQFDIGANFHATSTDFNASAFIRQYHVPSVRAEVISQLQVMASSGASVVKTLLWQVGGGSEQWRLSFPLSTQDLTNIQTYAQDVAAVARPGGGYLSLQLTMAWLGCADYTVGSPSTTVGLCGLTWNTFKANAQASINGLVQRVGGITSPDGKKVVTRLYLELEVMIGAKANQDQFLIDLYPYFLTQTAAAGLDGSIYFNVVSAENEILDNNYQDSVHPILSGHRSLYWVYRSIYFLTSRSLPVPGRLEFSFYPQPANATYGELVERVFSDVQSVFPNTRAAVVETWYYPDARRLELGQAFAASYLSRGLPEQVMFWTTPFGGLTVDAAPPFDFGAFLLTTPPGASSIAATPNPCVPPAGQSTCTTTVNWSTTVASATAAVWLESVGGGPATRVGCGKAGQASVPGLNPNAQYLISLWATPWCDTNSTVKTGIQIAAVEVSSCTFGLNPASSGTVPVGGGSGGFTVTTGAGCLWTPFASHSWIHPSGSGKGSGSVSYTIDANSSAARTGSIVVGGQTFAISQAGITCSYSLTPSASGLLPMTEQDRTFTVTAPAGCSWTAGPSHPWIHTTSAGTGSGTVHYSVTGNPGPMRTGSILVGGQTFAVQQDGVNILQNGDFSQGLTGWQALGLPDSSHIVSSIAGGVFQFYRVQPAPGASNQAFVMQETGVPVANGGVLAAQFDLGNSSTVRKRISVLLLNANFSDLSVCTFWIPAGTTLRRYEMRMHTTQAWSNAAIYFYAATAGSDGGSYLIDNVRLAVDPSGLPVETRCVDPFAPAPPGGADGPELLVNGGFGQPQAGWSTFGSLDFRTTSGVFEFRSQPQVTDAGGLLQSTGVALAPGEILTAQFQLGNSSAVRKRVTVLLHDLTFSDLSACTFWIAPGQSLSTYTMRMYATKAWSNATVSIYNATSGTEGWVRLDNVSLRRTPGTATSGTDCLEQAGGTGTVQGAAQQPESAGTAVAGRDTTGRSRGENRVSSGADGFPAVGPVTLREALYSAIVLRALAGDDPRARIEISFDGVTWMPWSEAPFLATWLSLPANRTAWARQLVYVRLTIDGRSR